MLSDSYVASAPAKRVKIVCGLLIGVLALAGAGLLSASLIPFVLLQAKVRGMSASGGSAFFDESFYTAMMLRLRLIGICDLGLAALGFGFRRWLYRAAERIAQDSLRFADEIQAAARSIPRSDWVGLAALTGLAGALRIPLLSQPMRDDEASTFIEYIARPIYVTLSFYNGPDNHLLHTLLVRISYGLLGNHPWNLRLPALAAGILLVPATYVASRCLYRTGSGLLAAGLVASSSILIEFSTNARGYGLFALEVLLLVAVASYAMRHQNWAAWFLLGVLAAAGFYTMPIMLYAFGGIAVWILLCALMGDGLPSARGVIAGLSAACALGALATLEFYSPVFAVSGPRAVLVNKWVKASPFPVFLHNLPDTLAATWQQWMRDMPWIAVVVLGLGFAAGVAFHGRCSRQRVPLLVGMALWIVPVILIQRVAPYERVWLFALPLFYIVASAGIALAIELLLRSVGGQRALAYGAVAVSLALAMLVHHANSVYRLNEGRGLEQMTLYLQKSLQPGDSVLVELPSDGPLLYYFKKHGVPSSYLNAPTARRVFAVVNEISGDSVAKVLEMSRHFHPDASRRDLNAGTAKLVGKYESACLYELVQAPKETQIPPSGRDDRREEKAGSRSTSSLRSDAQGKLSPPLRAGSE